LAVVGVAEAGVGVVLGQPAKRGRARAPQVQSFEAMQVRGAQLAGRSEGDGEDDDEQEEDDEEVGGRAGLWRRWAGSCCGGACGLRAARRACGRAAAAGSSRGVAEALSRAPLRRATPATATTSPPAGRLSWWRGRCAWGLGWGTLGGVLCELLLIRGWRAERVCGWPCCSERPSVGRAGVDCAVRLGLQARAAAAASSSPAGGGDGGMGEVLEQLRGQLAEAQEAEAVATAAEAAAASAAGGLGGAPGPRMVRNTVSDSDIAAVISRWTGEWLLRRVNRSPSGH
jgi:hypothetical protein